MNNASEDSWVLIMYKYVQLADMRVLKKGHESKHSRVSRDPNRGDED